MTILFVFLIKKYFFFQANKAGKSYKVPLSTFYVEEITNAVQLNTDIMLWWQFSKEEVKTNSTVNSSASNKQCVHLSSMDFTFCQTAFY